MDVILAFFQFLMLLVCLGAVGFIFCLILIWNPVEKSWASLNRRYKRLLIEIEHDRALLRMSKYTVDEAYEALQIMADPDKYGPEAVAKARRDFAELHIQIEHFCDRLNDSAKQYLNKLYGTNTK